MKIIRSDALMTSLGPSDWFTGTVHIQMLFAAEDPGRVSAGRVTFEPEARTHWHAHPFGQALVVTDGYGRVQRWGGPIEEIRAGDVITFDAAEKHWHGAAVHSRMTHLAIQEHSGGRTAEWMEEVSDAQYTGELDSGALGYE